MRISSFAALSAAVFSFLLLLGNTAESAEIKILCANGMQPVISDLAPKFERASGNKVSIVYDSGGGTIKRAQTGESADIIVAPKKGVDGLVKSGAAVTDAVVELANTGISVAVRKGAPKPDISTPEAFKRTLLAAKSISYLNPADGAASGIYIAKLLDRLEIADEMKSKTVFPPKTDSVGALVVIGAAEIGVTQYQLLFSVPGIDIVGPLPGNLQDTTVFSGAVLNGTKDSDASRALLTFLRSPEAAAVIKSKGMEPGAP